MAQDFCIIGAGKVGKALASLLGRGPWEFLGASSRSFQSACEACRFVGNGIPADSPHELVSVADLVLITTPDGVIQQVCRDLAESDAFRPDAVVAHCSGALPSDVLGSARECGAFVGSIHPLQTFATADRGVDLLPGSYCCMEGDAEAVRTLEEVARTIDARPLTIPTGKKSLYHASAVMACNYLTVLEGAAAEMGQAAGIEADEVLQALMPLIRGTLDNLNEMGVPGALTGPIARGDVNTVERHLEIMITEVPELVPMYCVLGQKAVNMARDREDIDDEKASALRSVLGS